MNCLLGIWFTWNDKPFFFFSKQTKKKTSKNKDSLLSATIQDLVVQNLIKFLADVTLKFLSFNTADTLIFFAEKKVSRFVLEQNRTEQKLENTLATTVNKFIINKLVSYQCFEQLSPAWYFKDENYLVNPEVLAY